MSFDDSIPVRALSLATSMPFCVGSGSRRNFFYDVFATFTTLAAAYFSRKEVVRLNRRSRLILTAAYLSRGLFLLV